MGHSLLTLLAPVSSAAAAEPQNAEVTDWVSRVTAAGGTVSASTRIAADVFMNDMDTASLRTKMLRLNLFAGSNLAAALVPIINDQGNTTESNVNSNFVSGDYSESTGLDAGAATGSSVTVKRLDTGLNPSTAGVSNTGASLGMYIRNTPADGNKVAIDCGTTDVFRLFPSVGGVHVFDNFNSTASQGRTQKTATSTQGFLVGSRISATDSRFYRNGVQIGTATTTSGGAVPNVTTFIFGAGNSAHCDAVSGGYFIGLDLTISDVMNLYNIFQAFNVALGRSV